jgi:hypothetical protein
VYCDRKPERVTIKRNAVHEVTKLVAYSLASGHGTSPVIGAFLSLDNLLRSRRKSHWPGQALSPCRRMNEGQEPHDGQGDGVVPSSSLRATGGDGYSDRWAEIGKAAMPPEIPASCQSTSTDRFLVGCPAGSPASLDTLGHFSPGQSKWLCAILL